MQEQSGNYLSFHGGWCRIISVCEIFSSGGAGGISVKGIQYRPVRADSTGRRAGAWHNDPCKYDADDNGEISEYSDRKGIKVEKGYYNQTSLIISGYDYIRTVPGFHEGLFTVQDESSSLQVLAAGIRSGDVILDVCAAPGGKTMYAAEQTGERGHVYARDISEEKVDKIDENLERLELHNVSTKVWDAAVPDPDMIEKADVVLADLPCSGLGVMARKMILNIM